MIDPVLLLSGWLSLLLGMIDTLVAAYFTPLFAVLGRPAPSLLSIFSGLG